MAIKKLTNLFNNIPETKRVLREIILLKKCSHPNIVKLVDVILPHDSTTEDFTYFYIVTEYCDADLQRMMKAT